MKIKTNKKTTATPATKKDAADTTPAREKRKALAPVKKQRARERADRLEKIKYLNHTQIKEFFRVIKNARDYALFLILYRRGLRASEIGMLEHSDLDMQHGYITVTRLKGSLPGRFKLMSDEMKAIRRYLRSRDDSSAFLFPNRYGQQLTRAGVYSLMQKYGELAGLPKNLWHPHCLKHSIATHLLEAGADLRFVQDALGHKEIENTVIYTAIANPTRDQKQRELSFKLPKL